MEHHVKVMIEWYDVKVSTPELQASTSGRITVI